MIIRGLTALAVAICINATAFAAGGGSSSSKKPSEYRQAVKAIKKEDYAAAAELLQKVLDDSPKNADAWNYMGYSLRNLGRYDEALTAYQTALDLKPKHKGALEYLGELYLQTDQPEKAKEMLARLDDVCVFTCKEYRELRAEIGKYGGGP